MKRTGRLLAAIASLALTAALLAWGAQTAAAAPAKTAPKGHGTCEPVAPTSRLGRQGAAWSCFKMESAPAPPRGTATVSDASGLCDRVRGDSIVSDRHAYCVGKAATYELLGDGEKVEGLALVGITIGSHLSSTKAEWAEDIDVRLVDKTANIKAVTLALRSTCAGQCVAGPPAWGGAPVVLSSGHTKDHSTLTYNSPVAKGFTAYIQPSYHAIGTLPDAERPFKLAADWPGPNLRCDAEVGQYPGCIVMGHLANVTIRQSLYGAAAVAYEWAQKNLTFNNFGTEDKPLHRDKDEQRAKDRRKRSCRWAPKFVKDPTVRDDSCDEFPFAKSREGGTPGAQCAEIIPRNTGGVWTVDKVRNPAGAPCIRAHVPRSENTGAGGELGRAVVADRIIDGEAYQVIVAP
ncbi:hypothetical protein ACIQU6_42005 [Streptomyces sp. NPDC090442]|uniref:NucA/NucB deoxyribonuclease domain-containing protein n=1 Tax=Streptomyces sp. NPDC090442 TaxID=3365962 RepID=UPI0037F39C1B